MPGRDDIVDEGAMAGEKPGVLDPWDPCARIAGVRRLSLMANAPIRRRWDRHDCC